MQPTVLMFNKNGGDIPKVEYADIYIIKSKIDDLALKHESTPSLLFLTAACIALTKYTNTTQIFIKTKTFINGKSHTVPLRFKDEDRKRTVPDYMAIINDCLSNPENTDELLEELAGESHFSYVYMDSEDDGADTSLIIDEETNLYRLKLKFDASKYTYSYVKSFLRSIKRVLNQFTDHKIGNLRVGDIALRDEKPAIKYELKRSPLVNVMLESQAKKTPDKIALTTCGRQYTFKQVNDEANRIANALIKRGIEKGSSISFMLARDKTIITTFLGIIKAGCVAIPLDMNYPAERINYIRKNSDSQYIITRESLDGAIDPQDLIDEGDASFPEVDLKPDDPIFLLYTSGSTGNPKGVISTHCGISNLTASHIKTNYNKLLSIASIAFDISEEDILLCLTNDMGLVFANDDEIRDVVLLANLIEKTKPEFVNLTPSRLLSYLQVPEFKSALRHLKGIGCGGEQFTKNVYYSIKECADIDVYNGYGPLETSLTSNSKRILNPDFITNGKPLFNYVTDVRDIDDKLLPYGVIGQLFIGGIGVSKGYYNLEEKTKEVFISLNGLPYYKSGDYAVELPSGEIIIRGRADNQIKLRGQRVDPEEIEQVIIRYGEINNAVVIIHEINNEMHLCAYFTCDGRVDINDLRKYLEKFLSEYMVPTFIVQMDEFPETPNGKIDRKKFPKPEMDTENIKPANDLEKTLYGFCRDILKHDDFGVTDNLFKLGFTSLTLMKLNSDIYHEFGINLKHIDLMRNPTIRKLSELIKNNTSADKIEKAMPNASNSYPMSSQQKRMYVLYRKNPDLTNYNLPNVVGLKGSIDVNKLEDAVNRVIEAEEILRTSLHVEDGEYIQKIHDKRPIRVESIELGENEDINEVFMQNIRPFKLETDPLLRIKVIESNGETFIFRDMHHAIGDQISNDLMYDKIKSAYYDEPFTVNDIQYKDYSLWVEGQKLKEAGYWKGREISEYGTVLMSDFERPQNLTFKGNRISCRLDKKTIEKQARDNNTTVYKLLLLHFVVLLYKCTDESTIQIGTVTSGRTHPDLEKTLGMFVNTLPFVQSLSASDTLKETLLKTEEELANLFANQNYSIERIIEDHGISTSNSYNPLFSIAFIQNTAENFDNKLEWDESKFDLTCTIKNSPSDLTVEFDYNKDLYSFEKINGLLKHYVNLIDGIGENMDRKIEDIDILSPEEKERIIEMAGVKEDVEYDSILTALRGQVAKNPEKIILSDCKSCLSYRDLDMKTNSLANYLKDSFGVEGQDNIVLIANRSIESVLGFCSILKLNAVYVPINPSAPAGRIRHIIDEVEAKVVLTNIDLELDDVCVVDLGTESLYDYDDGELEASSQGKLCILHTSGTTGVPKGVQITHENIENFLISAKKQFYDKNTGIVYHTTNIGFDTSLFEIIFSILNGIQLHVIDENYDFTGIPEDVLSQKSMINTVPAKLKMFLTLPNFENVMANVGQLILAGEVLTESLVAEIRKDYNPVIYNAYGPCEATIFASIKKVLHDKVTIGKANINTQIYILNNERQLCPIGIPGELCIGGKQVADGYLNNADETDRHFIKNPFDDGTMYCTGDLAYLDKDGEINFIGRADTQIKINGQRIEVDEINRQIEKNDDIIQAVTVANSTKTQLYSYVVGGDAIDIDKLLDDLENVLLPFMVPSSIMQIDYIPLNSSGKIDTKKLPKPKAAKYKYSAPTNDVEKAIVKVWEKIFDVKQIGVNDNFHRLGGDSIKAIRIVSLLQNEGIFCSPRDILNYRTPYLIAQNVGKSEESYENVEGIFDLLPIQNYFFDQINRNDYTQEFVLKSAIDLDIDILQKALNELTNLHDMLRAIFHVENEGYTQEILPLNTRICEIKEYEINGNFDEGISEIIKKAKSSLDVFNNLMDVSMLRYNDECYLIFVIHHLIVDGVSWSIMLDDLTYIYTHLSSEDEKNLNNAISRTDDSADVSNSSYGNLSEGHDDSVDYVAPTNALERMVADAFETVFNKGFIGLNDDFISLGGDSIMAIRVISLLGKNGIKYPAGDIVNYRTPYNIAQNIQNTQEVSHELVERDEVLSTKELSGDIYNNIDGGKINLDRPYSYKDWVGNVKELVDNISEEEKLHWTYLNGLLDDSQIRGYAKGFNFNVDAEYNVDNLLMLSEEEYWALAIARAYKKTYQKDIIFNRESYGRDESLANVSRTVGWFTSQYPVQVNIGNDYDDVSIVKDVYKLKTSFGEVNNLGLNYASLIYITNELKYQHCPVTFNFLSTEFEFEDDLFKSVNCNLVRDGERDVETYGIDLNIHRAVDSYFISGDYPEGTYLADSFTEFIDNIKSELEFIGNFTFKDNNVVCALSESQLEVYLNEKNYDMGNAYSTWDIVECPLDKSVEDIKNAIHALIDRHPVLRGRILDDGDMPLLICDSYPLIELSNTDDYASLIRPFDLERHLARFYIIGNEKSKRILYDIHHVINDATGFKLIENEFSNAFEGNLDKDVDLGFAYASRDSFQSRFNPIYDSAHEFYAENLANIDEVDFMQKDLNGSRGMVSLPIRGVKNNVDEFTRNNNITVGTFLNAVFAFTYSRFIKSPKVFYNFVEHGRHEDYIQNSLGMFARTTPILVDCRSSAVKDYLDYFSDLALNSMFNNVYPYRLLEKEFNLNNVVLFEYNLDLNDVSDIGDDLIIREMFKDSFSEFFCVINDLDDGYVLHINHADMFSSDTAVSFARLYARILIQMLDKENLDDIT